MAFNYLIPSISSLIPGYDLIYITPIDRLRDRLLDVAERVERIVRVFSEGRMLREESETVAFNSGPINSESKSISWRDAAEPGYVEVEYRSLSGQPVFRHNAVLSGYVIYSAPGRKSFYSDNAYKYGAPPTIDQIARDGFFCEGYPVVEIDPAHRVAQSFVFINPYHGPILVRLFRDAGRPLRSFKVAQQSAMLVRVRDLLEPSEATWHGRLQLSASNRIITYAVWHDYDDPSRVFDHEHMDPFRADPTHMPAFQLLRNNVGKLLKRYGLTP